MAAAAAETAAVKEAAAGATGKAEAAISVVMEYAVAET